MRIEKVLYYLQDYAEKAFDWVCDNVDKAADVICKIFEEQDK